MVFRLESVSLKKTFSNAGGFAEGVTEIQTLSNQRLHTPDISSSLVTLPKAPALLRATRISNSSCSSGPAIQFSLYPNPEDPQKLVPYHSMQN